MLLVLFSFLVCSAGIKSSEKLIIKLMKNVIIQRAITVRTVVTQSVCAVTDVKRILEVWTLEVPYLYVQGLLKVC